MPGASAPGQGKVRTVLTAEELLEALRLARKAVPRTTSELALSSIEEQATSNVDRPAKGRRKWEGRLDPEMSQTADGKPASSADPAIAIGLAIRLARIARSQRAMLPQPVTQSLRQAVRQGDATAPIVEAWAERLGVLPSVAGEVGAVKTTGLPTLKTGGDHE